ncbi:MAG: hypothetical protein J5958_03090 [Clostridia bacterium]|nr:hypothetical protein [Clostridia bacterium]
MDQMNDKSEKSVNGIETIDNGENQDNNYLDERKEEAKQINSFRSICRALVAILFLVEFIGGFALLSVEVFFGVCVIVVSVLCVVIAEKFIDVICNFFLDVKAIRVNLWENSQHK